jgi:hypothetical protein
MSDQLVAEAAIFTKDKETTQETKIQGVTGIRTRDLSRTEAANTLFTRHGRRN